MVKDETTKTSLWDQLWISGSKLGGEKPRFYKEKSISTTIPKGLQTHAPIVQTTGKFPFKKPLWGLEESPSIALGTTKLGSNKKCVQYSLQ